LNTLTFDITIAVGATQRIGYFYNYIMTNISYIIYRDVIFADLYVM